MLRPNTTKARENIRNYIINNFDCSGYAPDPVPESWPDVAAFILATFRAEKYSRPEDYKYYNRSEISAFFDWAAGLPSLLDTCYYYNRSAVDDLAGILEQNEKEKAKYTESQAEIFLTNLIYRELIQEERKK